MNHMKVCVEKTEGGPCKKVGRGRYNRAWAVACSPQALGVSGYLAFGLRWAFFQGLKCRVEPG